MLCVIMGIPGVGKSTVLAVASKISKAKVINFGDYMFAEAEREGLVKDRDYMRKLPHLLQIALQQKAAERIHSDAKDSNIIVDTHASVKTSGGYMPGMSQSVLQALNPNHFVLVEGSPADIYNRRRRDPSRKRDKDSIEDIEEHQDIDRSFVTTYTQLTGATLLIVKNEEGKAKEAGERIASIFKQA